MKLLREIHRWEEEWPRPVNPDVQWRAGRSAVELARAFFRNSTPRLPDAILEAFRATPRLAEVELLEGIPELTTSLPPKGTPGPRHHDVWLRGHVGDHLIGVGVEAKVDEPFDDPVSHKYRAAVSAREAGKSTDQPERYEAIASLVLRRSVTHHELRTCALRYQLMSGVAGTAIQASLECRPVAAFLVYELVTAASEEKKRNLNQTDFDIFLEQIGARREGSTGLFGPLHFAAGLGLRGPVELWLGKVTEHIQPERDDSPLGSEHSDYQIGTRDDFLTRCAAHVGTLFDMPFEDIQSNGRRIKISIPRRSNVFLRVEATNNRPRRIEVALKAGAAQVSRWPLPHENGPPGVIFEQWKDGGYTRSGFRWLRDADGFRSSQQRAFECIDFLASWAQSLP